MLNDRNDTKINQPVNLDDDHATPHWIVPLTRNSKFVGREDILSQLTEALHRKDESMAIAVLHGLGGVGCVIIHQSKGVLSITIAEKPKWP